MPSYYKHRTRIQMVRNFLFCLFSTLYFNSAFATQTSSKWITADYLRQEIDLYAQNHYSQTYRDKTLGADLIVRVGNIDSRLKLKYCPGGPSVKIDSNTHSIANATARVSCETNVKWSIYVPISIELYEQVLVSARLLKRGDLILPSDLNKKRVNIARFNRSYFTQIAEVENQQVKRTIRAGELVEPSKIAPARAVKKGDMVVLKAHMASIVVEVHAIAMEHGAVGEQIQVKNQQSERIVDATISKPGIVTVKF